MESGELPQDGKLARQTCEEAKRCFFEDDLLYHRYEPHGEDNQSLEPIKKQLMVPMCFRSEVLRNYHDDQSHAGMDRLYKSIREKFFWSSLYRDIRLYVKSCEICQVAKRDYHAQKAKLQPLPVVDLFARFHMDLIGPLKTSKEGFKYVLLCVESFSKWPEMIPLKSAEASEVATALYNNVFTRFGCPLQIVSDRGSNFMSALLEHVMKLFKVKRTYTSAYHPAANGQCERLNSYAYSALRCYLERDDEWPDLLQSVAMAYRGTVAASNTQHSPFHVMFGTPMRLPIDNELIPLKSNSATADEYVQRMLPKLELMREIIKDNTTEYQTKYKETI